MKLTKSLQAYNTSEFNNILKHEIQNVSPEQLPLQQGLSLSSYVGKSAFHVVVLNISEDMHNIKIKAGIFYTGIIAGCSCSDDPSPIDEQNEYCELQFDIDKITAKTMVKLLKS